MKQYIKNRELHNGSWIESDGRVIINPTEDMLIKAGFEPYEPQPTLEQVINDKLAAIDAYDQSEAVNGFTLDGKAMWLDRGTRLSLMRRFEAQRSAGIEATTLWYGSESFTLPVEQAITMLNAIELYACQCYDVTAAHKAAVEGLTEIEAVVGYDYTAGYPFKLFF